MIRVVEDDFLHILTELELYLNHAAILKCITADKTKTLVKVKDNKNIYRVY